ncbi:TraR conjugal transfer protein [Yersinia kristensenii]|nr:TraR conjugal transfer protein [Yersinia kristensenii]
MHVINHLSLFICTRISLAAERIGRNIVQGLVFIVTLSTAQVATADDDLAGMINNMTDGIVSIKPGLMKAAQVAGIGCVLVGIALWARKKNDPHVKGSHIAISIGIGCILIALDQFIKRGQSQAGLQPVSLG